MGRLSYTPIESKLGLDATHIPLTLPCLRSLASMRSTNQRNHIHNGPALPIEVILLIAEELLAMGRTSDLAAMSLLGSDYAPVIQQILFRHVHVTTYNRYARLMRTFQSGGDSPERCHALASLVRRISVVLGPYSHQDEVLRPHHLTNLYDNLPMLEFVDLTEAPMSGLGRILVPFEEDVDRMGTLEFLRSVALTGHLGPVGRPMFLGLPCLEELCLFGHIPASLFSSAYPRSSHSLRRLTWGCTTAPTLQRIRWAFGQSEEVIDGELVLLSRPNSETELNAIRQYAHQRNMVFRDNSI
ncbi:unnamed protein product [Rhizoctonia solani]|uniref:F-box domain-containing protein n=1 Tax=Rhizoctonia solani TaxID=456999 RepID=A0A8H3A295_9AGAM|nr:unnamed protein product [Rhizoctonia solani]